MATLVENLTTAQNNIGVLLASMTANPQPNYSLDGESYSWADYLAMLLEKQKQIAEAIQIAGGPFDVQSFGR